MDISFGDQKITLNIFRASKHMREEEDYNMIDVIEDYMENNFSLVEFDDLFKPDNIQSILDVHDMDSKSKTFWSTKSEPLPKLNYEPTLPSIQAPP